MSGIMNPWLAVNERRVDSMTHALETLRMQNVDLSGITTFNEIKQLLIAMKIEIVKGHQQILTLEKIISDSQSEN